jgi:hypothetical protein
MILATWFAAAPAAVPPGDATVEVLALARRARACWLLGPGGVLRDLSSGDLDRGWAELVTGLRVQPAISAQIPIAPVASLGIGFAACLDGAVRPGMAFHAWRDASAAVRADDLTRLLGDPQNRPFNGRMVKSEVQKVVNSHLREVQACYEKQLVGDHSLAGWVKYIWVIETSGTVGLVRFRSGRELGAEVPVCIQQAIARWRFPRPDGGAVTVIYPFIFGTVDGFPVAGRM